MSIRYPSTITASDSDPAPRNGSEALSGPTGENAAPEKKVWEERVDEVEPSSSGPTLVAAAPDARHPHTEPSTAVTERDRGHHNEVVVIGRITAAPTVRDLPSGDRLVAWRVGVARPRSPQRPGHRLDSVTLVSFDEEFIDRVRHWRVGTVIRVTGALRRRIWRGRQGVRSVLEVEVTTAEAVARERE